MIKEHATIEYTLEQAHEALMFHTQRYLVDTTEKNDGMYTATVHIAGDDYIILMNMVRARIIVAFRIFLA